MDGQGNVLVADSGNHRVRMISRDGWVSTLAGDGTAGFRDGATGSARFNWPRGVAVDGEGNVLVADTFNRRVRRIGPLSRRCSRRLPCCKPRPVSRPHLCRSVLTAWPARIGPFMQPLRARQGGALCRPRVTVGRCLASLSQNAAQARALQALRKARQGLSPMLIQVQRLKGDSTTLQVYARCAIDPIRSVRGRRRRAAHTSPPKH